MSNNLGRFFPTLMLACCTQSIAQVVGRLAGDQRGVVLDALVSAGLMEMLLAVIEDNASSSIDSRAAVSGLALLLLADLAAGSERAKVRAWHLAQTR